MEENSELFKSVEKKFTLIRRYRNRVQLLEKRRSILKRKLRETMQSQEHSLNYTLGNAQKIQNRIHRFSDDIRRQRYLQNFWWKNLKYEDRCRYRFWVANEPFPNDLYEQWEKTGPKRVSFHDWLKEPNHAAEMKKVIEEYDDKLTVIGEADFDAAPNSAELKVEMRLTRAEAEKIANKIIHFLATSDAEELILDLHDED